MTQILKMSFRRWCFTLNNYDEAELVSLRSSLSAPENKIRYAVWGKEVGAEGTPHIQGYFSSGKTYRLKGAKKLVGDRAHLEAAKGSEEDNYKYCTKDGDFEEVGTRKSPGKRTDLEAFMDSVRDGVLDAKELRQQHPDVCAKYPRFFEAYILDNVPQPSVTPHALHPWQAALNECLRLPPGDREILFVVDKKGNHGKTWFSRYYASLFPQDTCILQMGKKADMAYALPVNLRVLFVDVTRQQVEHMNYSFLESVKDGLVFSTKYESRMKLYGPVHVVVMMNQEPDTNMLSEDRYRFIRPESFN